jgi:hypothetical protein
VYFRAQTNLVSQLQFVARQAGGDVTVSPVGQDVADADSAGLIVAYSFTEERYCYSPYTSGCLLSADCIAGFSLVGPGFTFGNSGATSVALSRSGAYTLIVQGDCQSSIPGHKSIPLYDGLYETATMKPIIEGTYWRATSIPGRRAVTDDGRALILQDSKLQWIDAAGAHPIRHSSTVSEASTDRMGLNVVAVEAPRGKLRWMIDNGVTVDEDLEFSGSAPALSDDGAQLFFLAPDGSLRSYSRSTNSVR